MNKCLNERKASFNVFTLNLVETLLHKSISLISEAAAVCWILSPCSSVPVERRLVFPRSFAYLWKTSARTIECKCPTCGTKLIVLIINKQKYILSLFYYYSWLSRALINYLPAFTQNIGVLVQWCCGVLALLVE